MGALCDERTNQLGAPPGAVAGPWWGNDGVGAVEIVGGTACEYFRTSNCGILTCVAICTVSAEDVLDTQKSHLAVAVVVVVVSAGTPRLIRVGSGRVLQAS
jgi:hypothetical protein